MASNASLESGAFQARLYGREGRAGIPSRLYKKTRKVKLSQNRTFPRVEVSFIIENRNAERGRRRRRDVLEQGGI
jgi:hypothetical protein